MKRIIIFFRGDHFYPTEYPASYSNWQAEADRNPGTTKIMDALTGKLLWLPSVAARRVIESQEPAEQEK